MLVEEGQRAYRRSVFRQNDDRRYSTANAGACNIVTGANVRPCRVFARHNFESTKTTSKELANKIWKKREREIALGLFKVGWPGERMTFAQLCEEFERSHFAGLAKNTVRGHRTRLYGKRKVLHFRDSSIELDKQLAVGACN